jgi:hypothetical protein
LRRGAAMANTESNESWAIPLLVVQWAVIAIGLIMIMVVILMH